MTWTNEAKTSTTWTDNIEYLVSQALDFLMTQDGKYLITNQSLNPKPDTSFNTNTKPANSWTNTSK